jgi:hypothetical protein
LARSTNFSKQVSQTKVKGKHNGTEEKDHRHDQASDPGGRC